jgi:hypothetical protein
MMNTFFEEVARYPEGEVRYTLPGGAAGVAPTTGKTKWYEWVGYAGLAIAAVGLALLTAGASIPATVCFAAGAVAGGVSAGGHLVDTTRLGTATTATVVLDVAQIVASFSSFGAMSITVKAGSASAALAGSRWFVPVVSVAAAADGVQLVALTELTFTELNKIQRGAGTPEDQQRAMAVLLTQLAVASGLTALSVQGARNIRAMAGKPLEVVEQNGVNVLRVVGEPTPEPAAAPKPAAADTHSPSNRIGPKPADGSEHGSTATDNHGMTGRTHPEASGATAADQALKANASRESRLKELATDPAQGGAVTAKTLREADVGLALEEAGRLPKPITRDLSGRAEFLDGASKRWDVKRFNSSFPPPRKADTRSRAR